MRKQSDAGGLQVEEREEEEEEEKEETDHVRVTSKTSLACLTKRLCVDRSSYNVRRGTSHGQVTSSESTHKLFSCGGCRGSTFMSTRFISRSLPFFPAITPFQ